MTRDEILAMVPGRKLDALVAEKVMGWKPVSGGWRTETKQVRTWESVSGAPGFKPSTEIARAWEVREWLLDNRGGVRLERFCDTETPEYCEVYRGKERKLIQVWATTTPEAICKAALLAMEGS